MTKTQQAAQVQLIRKRLADHPELVRFKDNALPILGLALYVQADDIEAMATEALTDGANDKSVDFCLIDRATKRAFIAQGYMAKDWGRQEAPASKASDLMGAVGWLFSGDPAKVPEKLRAATQELRRAVTDGEINRVHFLYIHNCQESENVENELRTVAGLAEKVLAKHPIAITYCEIGLSELDKLCRASESEILVPDVFDVTDVNVIYESGPAWRAIVAAMPGEWLHTLHARYGNRLFSANYRDYLGMRNSRKNINFGITKSVQTDPGNFWTYNNGITALVRRIIKRKGKYRIEGISIINGAQTTGAIGESSRVEATKIKVPFRMVECTDKTVVHNIIRYNNTQNEFRSSDQRSTDAVQRRLAKELAAYKISYVHRRSVAANPRKSISAESIAPLLCAFHGDPQKASRNRNDIFDLDSVYSQVFPVSCRAEHVLMVHCLGCALDEVKLELKAKNADDTLTKLEIKNYEVLKYSTSKLFFARIIAGIAEEILLRKVPDLHSWRFNPNLIKPDLSTLVFPWKEAVHAVLPHVASLIGERAYEATRDFANLPDLETRVAAAIASMGNSIAQRFAPLRDATTL